MTIAAVRTEQLSPLETATSIVVGRDPSCPPLERRPPCPPRTALERALLRALARPPCAVAFSGGRDSSAMLALAVRLARAHGLPEPVPVTLRFPEAARTVEDEWQDAVIAHLGVADWQRLEIGDELDLVGPVAQRVMDAEGLPYPYNLHLLLPMIEVARGGSLITGVGGDQATPAAGRELDVLARRIRPVPRDGLRIAIGAAPATLRRPALRGRVGMTFPWLSADGNAALTSAWRAEEARRPLRFNARLRELWRSRVSQLTLARIAALGHTLDAEVVHPFLDPGFLSALAALGGPTGFPDRTTAVRALFGDDLPARVTGRATKASFNEVLWNRPTRRFVAGLDATRLERALRGLELDALVDPAALLSHWRSDEPLANSFLLLQACFLAETG